MQTRPNIVEWAILHMMTVRDKHWGVWKNEKGELKNPATAMDVCLTIDGVEVNPVEMLEEIQRQNDMMIAEKAKQIVEEKCSSLFEKIRALESALEASVEEERKRLFGETDYTR